MFNEQEFARQKIKEHFADFPFAEVKPYAEVWCFNSSGEQDRSCIWPFPASSDTTSKYNNAKGLLDAPDENDNIIQFEVDYTASKCLHSTTIFIADKTSKKWFDQFKTQEEVRSKEAIGAPSP